MLMLVHLRASVRKLGRLFIHSLSRLLSISCRQQHRLFSLLSMFSGAFFFFCHCCCCCLVPHLHRSSWVCAEKEFLLLLVRLFYDHKRYAHLTKYITPSSLPKMTPKHVSKMRKTVTKWRLHARTHTPPSIQIPPEQWPINAQLNGTCWIREYTRPNHTRFLSCANIR